MKFIHTLSRPGLILSEWNCQFSDPQDGWLYFLATIHPHNGPLHKPSVSYDAGAEPWSVVWERQIAGTNITERIRCDWEGAVEQRLAEYVTAASLALAIQ